MPPDEFQEEALRPGMTLRLRGGNGPATRAVVIEPAGTPGDPCTAYQVVPADQPNRSQEAWRPAAEHWSKAPEFDCLIRLDRPVSVAPESIDGAEGALSEEGLTELHRRLTLFHAREFSRRRHRDFNGGSAATPFDSARSPVPYSGRVFDEREVLAAVGSSLDFWLTLGENGARLESELAARIGVRRTILTNSGSSANLLAVSALSGNLLSDTERLRPGDEVITCAAGFPTTVAPILQNGLIPVFIDNDPVTGNADVSQLEAAYRPDKTRAVILAHTLGNPFDLGAVLAFCRRHGLWLIEDNCDALGSTYTMPRENARELGLTRPKETGTGAYCAWTGAFGDLSTQSFYPPHHLTMGEGGAVNIRRNMRFKRILESFRDWGRDCWCASGKDNTCGKRFGWKLGELPEGYDHKYIYSHLGYNLKPLDLQAAIGLVQLQKLDAFGAARRRNWHYLRAGLADLDAYFGFTLPTHATEWSENGFTWGPGESRCDPSWFGFMLRVRPEAPFSRVELARALDAARIGNRGLFGGNLLRQPVFTRLRRERPDAFRVAGDLTGADQLMNEAIFLGVFPGLQEHALDYVIEFLHDFCTS